MENKISKGIKKTSLTKQSTRRVKVAFFEIEKWQEDYLKKQLAGFELKFFKEALNKKHIAKIKDVNILAPFIYSKVSKDVIEALPNLKLITTLSTGFDHIDLKAAKAAKVKVANVPHYGENTVAEHTFALILSLSRKIHQTYERTSRGNFSLDNLRGFDLKDKTIGIIGCGSIGQHVARMAKGFEMNILVYDVKRNQKLAKKFGFKYATLNNLLTQSDVITLHAPYMKATHHLINRQNIKLVKQNALIINTARGGLIDTTALVDALRAGKLAGLGLDVLEEEKFILKEEAQMLSPYLCDTRSKKECMQTIVEGHMLLMSNKVIVTPHNAFNSQEALERILDTTIENIKACCSNKKIKNLVN